MSEPQVVAKEEPRDFTLRVVFEWTGSYDRIWILDGEKPDDPTPRDVENFVKGLVNGIGVLPFLRAWNLDEESPSIIVTEATA